MSSSGKVAAEGIVLLSDCDVSANADIIANIAWSPVSIKPGDLVTHREINVAIVESTSDPEFVRLVLLGGPHA